MYAISATRVRRLCNQPNSQAVDAVENYSKIKYVNPRQKIFVRSSFICVIVTDRIKSSQIFEIYIDMIKSLVKRGCNI